MTNGTFQDYAARIEVFKKISTILAVHDFSEDKGLCTDLGQHKDNHLATIYFTQAALDGDGQQFDNTTVLETSSVERDIFGAMPGKDFFAVSQDDNGFWYGEWIDQLRANAIATNYEIDHAADSED